MIQTETERLAALLQLSEETRLQERKHFLTIINCIVPYMQQRADKLRDLCYTEVGDGLRVRKAKDESYWRNAGASTAIHNLANEIGSFYVNKAICCWRCEGKGVVQPIDSHACYVCRGIGFFSAVKEEREVDSGSNGS